MLIYHCPTTARVVHSSVEDSEAEVRRLSALKLSLWCPYCQLGHAVLGKDIQVKVRTTQCEQISSGLPSKPDIN
jgi:hypothetical protein